MKLKFILIALFVAFATQAQTITQEGLLGKWHMAKFEMDGVFFNFETAQVTAGNGTTLSPEEVKQLKEELTGAVAEQLKSNTMTFKPGGKVIMAEGEKSQEVQYTLSNKEDKQTLVVKVPEEMVFFVAIKDNFLELTINGHNPITMYLKKDK
ncbi:hypothetical protein AM493_18640 [Flavobacterium akiainvivens]|uniref:Lipocalin-like domain-containing protein n=1 Tax=Flavobacterium akiainvivens TaxID=1202724 RepID=A0A0N0RR40_9FLAO|nr:hypothetical protein [Flavobacterium akiainvivens]KOS07849.1 hypothetical protein AM493_18640 [Flavobacterium akiainvivens]SFQ27497.1 hypothetical protein SAMN05444144_102308 [Flavobacterium akiainvivens]